MLVLNLMPKDGNGFSCSALLTPVIYLYKCPEINIGCPVPSPRLHSTWMHAWDTLMPEFLQASPAESAASNQIPQQCNE